MDFTPELSAFQGVIISADNVHRFSRLTSKGGNEEQIKYVLDCMLRFLKGENFVNENGITDATVSKVRKFALYIVLNADLPVLEEIVELEGIDLVIWTIPTIPKHLMCEMLWNLHMEIFVFEIIAYSYPQLALEVLGAFIDNFKYFNPTECLQKLHKLTAACYSLICRLHCFEFEIDALYNNLEIALEHIQKLSKYFVTLPNSYKMNALSKDDSYKYRGRRLHTALSLLYECFSQFTQKIDQNSCDDIYKLTYKEGCFKGDCSYNICDSPNVLVLECLHNSNTMLLDATKELVMDVSVDVFCAWSEFEDNGKSMQQTIGELCHKIRTKLMSIESVSGHAIVSMIEQIARKPTEIKDIINTLDSKTINDNINKNDEDKTSWIQALIYKDNLWEHTDLMQVIDAYMDVYNKEECYKLYNIFKAHMNDNTENSLFIKLLSLKLFQHCTVSDKHKIIKDHFTNNCFCDISDGAEFMDTLTDIFNRLIATPDADLTDVLTMFLQNPKQVYTTIFSKATENIHQLNIMLEIMVFLQDYSNYYYNTETDACIISVTKYTFDNAIDTESKQVNFIKFICGFKRFDIIPGTKLLLLVVMPNVHKALLNKDINAINVQIRLLQAAYAIDELMSCRAPMLAMLAQVMDVVRWRTITSFVSGAPGTLQLTLQLQNSLLETYNGVVPDKESKWLKTKLQNIEPMNMYYYRILWNPPGKNYFEVISHKSLNSDTNPSELKFCLTQIICTSTQPEWCEVWDSLSVFDDTTLLKLFHEALGMMTKTVARHRTEATRACLLYCYRNLAFITRYKFFKEPLTNNQVVAAVGYLASLLRLTHADDVEDIGTALMPLLAYLAEKQSSITIDLPKSMSNIFKDTSYLDLIGKVFAVSI